MASGRHGISIPIRDPGVGDAMFSINFECDDRHGARLRQRLVNDYPSVRALLSPAHEERDLAARPVTSEFDLSPREREVLKWAADGKTAWETAQLLASASGDPLYTENAMNKLRAKTRPRPWPSP